MRFDSKHCYQVEESETHFNVDKFSDTLLEDSSPKIQKQKMLLMK